MSNQKLRQLIPRKTGAAAWARRLNVWLYSWALATTRKMNTPPQVLLSHPQATSPGAKSILANFQNPGSHKMDQVVFFNNIFHFLQISLIQPLPNDVFFKLKLLLTQRQEATKAKVTGHLVIYKVIQQ